VQFKSDIRDFIVESFLYGANNGLGDDVSFLEKGIIDSTGILELVSFVQDTFGITVQDEEILPENFDSINKLSSFVSGKMNNR
jgi:acyl carrier protein